MSSTLTPEEIVSVSGGYRRPGDQLRALHSRGFYRAFRSKVTGAVVLERPHYDAVCQGVGQAANDPGTPKLRKPAKR